MTKEETIIQSYKNELSFLENDIKLLKQKVDQLQQENKKQKDILNILKGGYMWLNKYSECKKIKEWLEND